MKRIAFSICLIVLLAAELCIGENIYTWTDPQGVVHVSNESPGRKTQNLQVMRYQSPKAEPDLHDLPAGKINVNRSAEQPATRDAEALAVAAEKKAEAARQFAREAQQNVDTFNKKTGGSKKRIKKNRSEKRQLEMKAEFAREQAAAAEQAARDARAAADSAKQTKEPGTAADTGP